MVKRVVLMVGKGKFIVSTLFSFSEREKLNRMNTEGKMEGF